MLKTLAAFVGRNLDDVVACAGFVCVVYGVSQWSGPAAWVLAGSLLIAVAVWPHIRKAQR